MVAGDDSKLKFVSVLKNYFFTRRKGGLMGQKLLAAKHVAAQSCLQKIQKTIAELHAMPEEDRTVHRYLAPFHVARMAENVMALLLKRCFGTSPGDAHPHARLVLLFHKMQLLVVQSF